MSSCPKNVLTQLVKNLRQSSSRHNYKNTHTVFTSLKATMLEERNYSCNHTWSWQIFQKIDAHYSSAHSYFHRIGIGKSGCDSSASCVCLEFKLYQSFEIGQP